MVLCVLLDALKLAEIMYLYSIKQICLSKFLKCEIKVPLIFKSLAFLVFYFYVNTASKT